jgi:ribosomal subunit interface protein
MELNISAKNLTVSDIFRDYVSERAEKVDHLLHRVQELDIKVTRHDHSRNSGPEDQVELTVFATGQIIRAEAHAQDKFSAFDMAWGKLTERLRRANDRRKPHHGHHGAPGTAELTATEFASLDVTPADLSLLHPSEKAEEAKDFGSSPVVIRRKEFQAEKMSADDAITNMELLGHDFYLFLDADNGKPSVAYRRKGWNYGVIALL